MEKLILLIIAGIVWAIVQYANRNAEGDKPDGTRRAAAKRGPNSDIDRFLQEVDRLRKEQAPVVVRQAEPVVVRVVESAQDVRPKRKERKDSSASDVKPAMAVAAAVSKPNSLTHVPRQRPTTIPAMAALAMLRDKNTAAAAFVLHEILDAPKCRRIR